MQPGMIVIMATRYPLRIYLCRNRIYHTTETMDKFVNHSAGNVDK